MQGIRTQYKSPTDRKGARFIARAHSGGSITQVYNHVYNDSENHKDAATRLYKLLEAERHWPKISDGSHFLTGCCFNGDWYWHAVPKT
jgi:hypothetical protein